MSDWRKKEGRGFARSVGILVFFGAAMLCFGLACSGEDVTFDDEVDGDVVGAWRVVDYVDRIEEFAPGSQEELYYAGFDFVADGTIVGHKPGGQSKALWFGWAGDMVRTDDGAFEVRCVFREIDGVVYLFLPWLSGDVTERGMDPQYYVLTPYESISAVPESTANGTPEIDGVRQPGEWDQAQIERIGVPIPDSLGGGIAECSILLMNDHANLYIGAEIVPAVRESGVTVLIRGEVFEVRANGEAVDVWDFAPTTGLLDTVEGGTLDLEASVVIDSQSTYYEIVRPLDTGDPLDAKLEPNETVEIRGAVAIRDGSALEQSMFDASFLIATVDAPTEAAAAAEGSVLGEWVSIDYLAPGKDFDPGRKAFPGEPFLKKVEFLGTGDTTLIFESGSSSGDYFWSDGLIRVAGYDGEFPYELREIDGIVYLFFPWISGDVTQRGADPGHYVLVREGSNVPALEDRDGDGVPDGEDLCPDWPGSEAMGGC